MSGLGKIKEPLKARIGLYSAGLHTYWDQFAGLKDCLTGYNRFLESKLSEYGEVFNFGLVDTEDKGREAGEYFNRNNCDIIFSHAATYYTSSCVLPVHQICSAPAIILNLQPTAEMSYETTGTDRWLAQCVGCPVPEISNAFNRANIPLHVVNGLLGLSETPAFAKADENTADRPEAKHAWKEIEEWCMAASVRRTLQHARFGFLGGYYSGMLDMYSDFTMLQAQTGMDIKVLEMGDLAACLEEVTDQDVKKQIDKIHDYFVISGDSPSDPIAKKPTEEQMQWSARVADAEEKLIRSRNLDSLSYYCHGRSDRDEKIQSGFIVGFSLLNAEGIACSGEGDIKTALAMKIADICGKGGSFCEIVASDFNRNTIILGHDGPFHPAIAKDKPILRGLGVYHGKRGSGVSVEAKVQPGPVTTLGVTQTGDGKLKFNISEGEAVDAPILLNGNTSTHIRFREDPVEYMDRWFAEAPTHHLALSVGHNASLFIKIAQMMDIPYAVF
ncbi:MAG: L-arabinose isomerase family protein [Bilifractor sp.]|jgi:L-arabinose isomerase